MHTTTIIGNGNLGYNLYSALNKVNGFRLCQWYGRSWGADKLNKRLINNLSELKNADIFILAVSDSSIIDILKYLNKNYFVVHCSGATSIEVFKKFKRAGVMYPVQTINKIEKSSFNSTPFCIEAKSKKDLELLKKLTKGINGTYQCLNSNQRANVHLSAVWINNFVNHMISKGKKICVDNNISFSLMEPILRRTVSQAINNNPDELQTGPAIRNDKNTLKLHSNLIKNFNDKKLYEVITKSIQKNYEQTEL